MLYSTKNSCKKEKKTHVEMVLYDLAEIMGTLLWKSTVNYR